jgi:hypothetical protein
MSASSNGLTISGQQRDLVIQAAMTYDEMQKRIRHSGEPTASGRCRPGSKEGRDRQSQSVAEPGAQPQ